MKRVLVIKAENGEQTISARVTIKTRSGYSRPQTYKDAQALLDNMTRAIQAGGTITPAFHANEVETVLNAK